MYCGLKRAPHDYSRAAVRVQHAGGRGQPGKVATLVNLTDATETALGALFVGNANKLNFAPRVGLAYDGLRNRQDFAPRLLRHL